MIEALSSRSYQHRLRRARRFEYIEGGGVFKKIERLFKAPGIYIPYLLYAKAGMSRWLSSPIKLFWGRTVWFPLNDYDALILYMYGGRGAELKLTKFLITNLKEDDVFYDIGANRGFYTFLAAELCKEVHAFEPMQKLADGIKKNVRAHERLIINIAALSEREGSVSFYTTDSTMVSTINAAVAEGFAGQGHSTTKKITVPTMTLDAYVAAHAKPTVLKIDAEGAEEQIIKGGERFFASNAPVIAMEIWGKENKWELSMGAAERLRGMGYRSFRMDDEGELQEAKGDLSVGVSPRGGEDFIFKK